MHHRTWKQNIAVLVLGLLIAVAACGPKQETGTDFPAFVYKSAESLQGYRLAVANADMLKALPCYCGCVRSTPPHKHLYDCFINDDGTYDDHASSCDVCVRETKDAVQWQKEGKSLNQIRDLIDQKYQETGDPTDTPAP